MFKFERLQKKRAHPPLLHAGPPVLLSKVSAQSSCAARVLDHTQHVDNNLYPFQTPSTSQTGQTVSRFTAAMSLLAPSPLNAFEQERLDRIAENRRRMGKLEFPCSPAT
jgi:hypothetical protein